MMMKTAGVAAVGVAAVMFIVSCAESLWNEGGEMLRHIEPGEWHRIVRAAQAKME